MRHRRILQSTLTAVAVVAAAAAASRPSSLAPHPSPQFEVDPWWPKPLPGKWILGQVSGLAVDSRDHVWILHRPKTLTAREAGAVQTPPISQCCVPAPPVIELDPQGNVVRSWGGPGRGHYWPESEHTIHIDHKGNVWIGSNDRKDQVVLKFSPDGKLLLQIGQPGKTGGSNDTTLLGQPAGIHVDGEANEVYIADGYGNRRVIVFDAETGRYKRHWGAYGKRPADDSLGRYDPKAPRAQQFRSPVHAVLAPETLAMGSVWDLALSHDRAQTYLYVPDGTNQKVWILRRDDLSVVGEFGRGGRNAGQFGWVHNLAVDSRGNIYTSEVDIYKRVQKFVLKGW
jgi:hypothetical protein